jgi:hypothetical protein
VRERERESRGLGQAAKCPLKLSPVDPLCEPLQDSDEVVTSIDPLFFSGKNSGGIDEGDALQDRAPERRTLQKGNGGDQMRRQDIIKD